jgi:hypothetical protein
MNTPKYYNALIVALYPFQVSLTPHQNQGLYCSLNYPQDGLLYWDLLRSWAEAHNIPSYLAHNYISTKLLNNHISSA